MATAQSKSLDQPDETRPVEKGKVEVVNLDKGSVLRSTFEPGWRWSECVKPIVGGGSRQVDHFGYSSPGGCTSSWTTGDGVWPRRCNPHSARS